MIDHVCIIAEAGVNHDGDVEKAKALVDVAAEAGADVVKFQTFKADLLVTRSAPQADYQTRKLGTQSQYDLLKALELSTDEFIEIKAHCDRRGILFMSSPFDEQSLDFLVNELEVERLKFGSGELSNTPLLHHAAQTGLPIICSTGMSNLDDVRQALGALAHGYVVGREPKSSLELAGAYELYGSVLNEKVAILHCTTEYPAPYDSVNLRAMTSLRESFGLETGLSDHTTGIEVAMAATAMGASIIEKHFTLDPRSQGPDHQASLGPEELKALVRGVRNVSLALGSGQKDVQAAETGNRPVACKSLVASKAIQKGELFSYENMCCKRPGTGLPPVAFWSLLNQPSSRAYKENEMLEEQWEGA